MVSRYEELIHRMFSRTEEIIPRVLLSRSKELVPCVILRSGEQVPHLCCRSEERGETAAGSNSTRMYLLFTFWCLLPHCQPPSVTVKTKTTDKTNLITRTETGTDQ